MKGKLTGRKDRMRVTDFDRKIQIYFLSRVTQNTSGKVTEQILESEIDIERKTKTQRDRERCRET